MSHKKRYKIGSGNVFKDIGVPNAEEHLIKAQLVFKIDTILKKRGLKQVEAADLFVHERGSHGERVRLDRSPPLFPQGAMGTPQPDGLGRNVLIL